MIYTLRPYRDADAEDLASVIKAAIEDIGPSAYAADQVAAWSARHPGADRFRERVAENDAIIVAVDGGDRPVAYVLLQRDGHLDHLYNHPAHTRRGLAARLLAEAETLARAWGAPNLFTEASDLARPAFERAGYIMVSRRDFTIEHDGKAVPIHNWAMVKPLD